jgi:bisphosphoglycerate-dependent phosphoglycerate mutase
VLVSLSSFCLKKREAWAIEKKKYGHMKVQVLRKKKKEKKYGHMKVHEKEKKYGHMKVHEKKRKKR